MEGYIFGELSKVKFDKYLKKKGELKYLTWTVAYNEFYRRLENKGIKEEDIKIIVKKFKKQDSLGNIIEVPYMYDENTGYMVFTEITVKDTVKEAWLPVMDSSNKAMKKDSYKYKVKEYKNFKWTGNYEEKTVEPASMTDINKTIMRCIVKNMALFGLGLYIYNGEDLPEDTVDAVPKKITKEMEESLRELIKTKQIPDSTVLNILNKYGYKKLTDIKIDEVVKIRTELSKC